MRDRTMTTAATLDLITRMLAAMPFVTFGTGSPNAFVLCHRRRGEPIDMGDGEAAYACPGTGVYRQHGGNWLFVGRLGGEALADALRACIEGLTADGVCAVGTADGRNAEAGHAVH